LPRSERDLDREDVLSLNLEKAGDEANRCLNCGCVAVNASDMAPALIALAAKIKTTKRTVDAEDFFDAGVMKSTIIDPDELVTEIEIPLKSWSKQVFLKFSRRKSMDFSTVNIACVFDLDGNVVNDTRIVLGATAPVPFRTKEVEDFLKGKALTEEMAEAAAALAVKEANPLSKNRYKVKAASALMKNAILYAADN
jgi:CO/xanthine dehydrogenase FAD-binding subunit